VLCRAFGRAALLDLVEDRVSPAEDQRRSCNVWNSPIEHCTSPEWPPWRPVFEEVGSCCHDEADIGVCDPEVVMNHPALVVLAAKREVNGDCKRASTHERQDVERPKAAEQVEDTERSENEASHRTDVDPTNRAVPPCTLHSGQVPRP